MATMPSLQVCTNLVARIIHQKEWYDAQTIGLIEEAS